MAFFRADTDYQKSRGRYSLAVKKSKILVSKFRTTSDGMDLSTVYTSTQFRGTLLEYFCYSIKKSVVEK